MTFQRLPELLLVTRAVPGQQTNQLSKYLPANITCKFNTRNAKSSRQTIRCLHPFTSNHHSLLPGTQTSASHVTLRVFWDVTLRTLVPTF